MLKLSDVVKHADSKPTLEDNIKFHLLNLSKQLSLEEGDLLPFDYILSETQHFSEEAQDALVIAISELIHDGYFEECYGGAYLTKLGSQALYQQYELINSDTVSFQQITTSK